MAPRLSGQNSIFGVVFFVSKSLLGIEGQKKLEKFAIFTRKPRSHVRILKYRTWPIGETVNQINQIKFWFLRRGENRSTRRKTSRSKVERLENQQTQPTYDAGAGIEPGTHWWKASALTTAPTPLP